LRKKAHVTTLPVFKQAFDVAGTLRGTAEAIEVFFKLHLSDEEELAVQIILHDRLHE